MRDAYLWLASSQLFHWILKLNTSDKDEATRQAHYRIDAFRPGIEQPVMTLLGHTDQCCKLELMVHTKTSVFLGNAIIEAEAANERKEPK